MSTIYLRVCDGCEYKQEEPEDLEIEGWATIPVEPVHKKFVDLCPECYEEWKEKTKEITSGWDINEG